MEKDICVSLWLPHGPDKARAFIPMCSHAWTLVHSSNKQNKPLISQQQEGELSIQHRKLSTLEVQSGLSRYGSLVRLTQDC